MKQRAIAIGIFWACLLTVLAFRAPGFFEPSNIRDIAVTNAPALIVAIGMTLVILAGEIDVSVASQFAVASVIAGSLAKAGSPLVATAFLTAAAGAMLGLVNGTLVTRLGVPSIVATLATMAFWRELLRWYTQGAWVQGLPVSFQWMGFSQGGGEFAILIAAGLIFACFVWSLKSIQAGRAVYAVGSQRESARLAGIPVGAISLGVFILMGALTGIAALLDSVRFSQVQSNAGSGLELKAISAVVIGGASITGGKGNLWGTLLGAAVLAVIAPALTFLGINAFWEKAIQGAIILGAIVLERAATRRTMLVENRAGSERALLLLIFLEVAIFAFTGPNFFSSSNAFEVVRLGVELGLLALALTPVIATGGIDLSVGSMMGLCAVVFGYLWRDLHFPILAAAAITLLVGIAGGALNALVITRFGGAPLIVTLGTYSLFRGIAEGLTRGVDNFSQFPASFLYLGQGYLGGVVPAQLPAFVLFATFYYFLLHRSKYGRAFRAIGFGAPGARWAGIRVNARLGLVYTLSGFTAAAASLIYVAHLGQARSDAGTGYELLAITAVVLGGTDIMGGRGSVWGTLLGLCAIVVLQNGLRVSAFPAELAGILTSGILVVTIAVGRLGKKARTEPSAAQEDEVRNSQVAVLCSVILAGSLIVAGSNWWLVNSVRGSGYRLAVTTRPRLTLGVMPKAKGDPYFVSCRVGAEEAAKALNADMIWDGPTDLDPAKQNEIVEAWITRGVDSIAVSVVNGAGISGVLRKARAKGIKVITWDADAEPDARDFFINQATPQGLGDTLGDEANRIMGGSGDFAIITGALTAANQNEWIKYIKARIEKYPNIHLITVRPSDDDRNRAFQEAQTLMKVYPKMKLIMAISAPAVPGAAEAVKQSGRTDVKVTGLSLPNMCKPYVKAGIADSVVLWNTANLGYLVVNASRLAAEGILKRGVTSIDAGRLGKITVDGDQVLLGRPLIFTKANIDQYDF